MHPHDIMILTHTTHMHMQDLLGLLASKTTRLNFKIWPLHGSQAHQLADPVPRKEMSHLRTEATSCFKPPSSC